MVVQERVVYGDKAAAGLWCYLVSLGGRLFAVPDNDRTVLLPFISAVPQVTPLPTGLTPPYVLGLINIAQRGELLIDLPRLLGMRDSALAPSLAEGRRIVVVGEGPQRSGADIYRLAFAVDFGYELLETSNRRPTVTHPLGAYVNELLDTPRGEAALLNMEIVCNAVLHDMEATRLWNEADPVPEGEDL